MRRRSRGPERVLATLLFTDIVGSTELAARLGDRSWKALLARHNAIVRRELQRFGGRELDTAGDGFFAMFAGPAQAVDCAWATLDALKRLDISIRAGIHAGEVEVIGEKVGGIAVHAASRVLGLAGPGQILVTGIVRDLVAGSEIRFIDEGVRELRGVPGEWRLYTVSEAAMDRALPAEDAPDPAARRRSQAPILVAVGALAVVATAGIAVALSNARSAPPIVPRPDSVLRIDPRSDGFLALADVADPTGMASDGGAVWVLSLSGRTLNRIDAASGSVAAVGLPAAPTGIAAGAGAVWITTGFGIAGGSGGVLRVGAASRTIEATIPLGDGVEGIALGEGSVWVTNRVRNSVTRIDLTTRAVAGEGTAGEQPEAIVVGGGSVWVANAIDRTVWRLDPATLAKTAEISLADAPHDLALGFDRLWVTSSLGNSVTVIGVTTNRLQQTLEMPGPARGIEAGPDAVWVALGSGLVVRIDPTDPGAFRQIVVGGAPHDVAVDETGVWVSIRR